MTNRQQSFNELNRRVVTTTSIRYGSATRLSSHHRFSQWVVTLVSVALIIIPLFQAMKVPLKHSPQLLDAVEVLLAVIVLVYSLLLGNENYSGRAEKMLTCGLELGRLSRRIYPHLDKPHEQALYEELSEEYHDILEKYPNHDSVDYKLYRVSQPNEYYMNKFVYIFDWFSVKLEYTIGYWHYITVIVGVIATLLSIFRL